MWFLDGPVRGANLGVSGVYACHFGLVQLRPVLGYGLKPWVGNAPVFRSRLFGLSLHLQVWCARITYDDELKKNPMRLWLGPNHAWGI